MFSYLNFSHTRNDIGDFESESLHVTKISRKDVRLSRSLLSLALLSTTLAIQFLIRGESLIVATSFSRYAKFELARVSSKNYFLSYVKNCVKWYFFSVSCIVFLNLCKIDLWQFKWEFYPPLRNFSREVYGTVQHRSLLIIATV